MFNLIVREKKFDSTALLLQHCVTILSISINRISILLLLNDRQHNNKRTTITTLGTENCECKPTNDFWCSVGNQLICLSYSHNIEIEYMSVNKLQSDASDCHMGNILNFLISLLKLTRVETQVS